MQFGLPSLRSRSWKSVSFENRAKNCSIVNNSAVECSISFKFGTEFEHMTPDLLKTFGIRGQKLRSQRDVTTAKIIVR